MAQAAIPLMIGGALVKGVAGISAANQNTRVLNAQAHESEVLAVSQGQQVRSAARQQIGRQIAAQAESGFMPSTGSSLTALEESLINRELDIMEINRTAKGKADGLRAQAKQQKKTAIFGAVGEAIGAAGAIAGYKSAMAKAGT